MKMIKKIIMMVIISAAVLFPQEVIDRIVAVVDDEIIMQSELDFQVNLLAAQRKIDPKNPALRKQILDALIEEKLVFAQANLDSIAVTDDEVAARIQHQLDVFEQQYGSQEKIEQVYGMSIEKIRRELQDDVRKNLMVQKLQEQNFAYVEASRREVETFFTDYRDSIGIIPEKVKLYHIFRTPKPSEAVKERSKERAEAILDSVKKGSDFSEMAKKYSEDPGSASQGGDLGFVKRGVFYPEFESAAFAMEAGELSGIVESPVGYHIIQLLEKRGESIHTKHILIKIKADDNADINTINFLSDIKDSVREKKHDFSYYAKKYSEDKETNAFGGELGTYYINQLDKNLLDAVSKLKEGDISFPKRLEFGGSYGYHIVYLAEREPQHPADLKTDYTEIKRLADEYKKQRLYREYIDDLKKTIFWEIRT